MNGKILIGHDNGKIQTVNVDGTDKKLINASHCDGEAWGLEVIQDKGFDLGPNSTHQIQVTLYYFDVKKTSMQFAVYNRTEDETEIVAQAQLIVNGKPKKKVTARGTATSVSTATLIIDEGGKFSQTDVSTAMKKVCEQLIKKLKLK